MLLPLTVFCRSDAVFPLKELIEVGNVVIPHLMRNAANGAVRVFQQQRRLFQPRILQNAGEGSAGIVLDDFAEIAGMEVEGGRNVFQGGGVAVVVDIDHNIGELVTAQLEIVLGVPMVHMKPQKLNNQRGDVIVNHGSP